MTTRRAESTRQRIAAAALELLRERGTQGLTMRQVAVRSDLSLSNLQYHFPSREELLVGLTEHHLIACREAVARGLEEKGELSLKAALEVSLCDDAVRSTAPPFRDLFALAATVAGVRQSLEQHYRAALDQLATALAQQSKAPPARCQEVATLLLTSIEGFYLLQEVTPVRAARMAAMLEEVATSMLRARPKQRVTKGKARSR